MSVVLLWWAAIMAAVLGGESVTASAPADAGAIERAIERLGSPRPKDREQALGELIAAGPAAYPALKRAMASQPGYEVRRQIRRAAQQIFFRQREGPPSPFLGIQLRTTGLPRTREGGLGVQVLGVIEGTAAAAAGLQVGDIIIGVDGQGFKEPEPPNGALQSVIGQRQVGDRVVLSLVRGGRRMEVPVVLGARPITAWRTTGDIEQIRAAVSAFNEFWRKEFDPNGEVDREIPSIDDDQWRIRPGMGPR